MFDYIQNIRSHHTVPCTTEILHTVMRSTIVGMTCAEIADCHEQMLRGEMSREDFEAKKSILKRRLPAFCFHAHFKNGRRLNNDAVPSGLSILDIDHIKADPSPTLPVREGEEQPKELPKEQSEELSKGSLTLIETLKENLFTCTPITDEETLATLKRLGIVLIHKTPSGEGLRLVFVIPQGMGLVESQQWLARQIGLKEFDEACKDLARCSFAVPEEYVLFLDEEKLFGDIAPIEIIDSNKTKKPIATVAPIEANQAATAAESLPSSISEKALKIFDLCREQAGLKDVDINARGSRHNSLLAILSVGAARLLSEAEAMAVVEQRMPEFYKESDCRQLIHDFYAKYHDDSKIMSATVQRINARAEQIAQLSKNRAEKEEEPEETVDTAPANPTNAENAIPPIPGLKQSLTGVPEKMRMPALCALLPMAAAYADDVTFRYCDGREQRLGLMSIVVGEQASGKSVCKDIIDLWRGPMDEDDEQGRRKEDEWKKKRKNRRANEKLDPEPEVLVALEPNSVIS